MSDRIEANGDGTLRRIEGEVLIQRADLEGLRCAVVSLEDRVGRMEAAILEEIRAVRSDERRARRWLRESLTHSGRACVALAREVLQVVREVAPTKTGVLLAAALLLLLVGAYGLTLTTQWGSVGSVIAEAANRAADTAPPQGP